MWTVFALLNKTQFCLVLTGVKSGPGTMHSTGRTDRQIVTLFSKISTSSFFVNDRVTLQALRTNMLKLQSVRAVWKLYQQCHHVVSCHVFCPITHELLGVAKWYLQCVDDDSTCNNPRPAFVTFEIGEIQYFIWNIEFLRQGINKDTSDLILWCAKSPNVVHIPY